MGRLNLKSQPPAGGIGSIRSFTSEGLKMEFAVILSLGGIGVHTFGENVGSLLVT